MGEWHSAPMCAFGTMKVLSAFKMYCRAENVPFDIANTITDQLKKYELDLKHADEDDEEEISPYNYVSEEYHDVLRQSEKYQGVIDSISPHPCGFVLSNKDLRREIGIIRLKPKQGSDEPTYAAFIDGATAERFGYLKNDNLGVTVVKLIAKIYERIGIPQPTVPELVKLCENNKPTWSMYAKGFTLGLNQAEKEKSTKKVMKYKPHNLSEMSAFVAAIRPGFVSMLDKFLNREHFDYGIPELDKLLQTPEMPNSFILYQELMMKVLQYAGFSAPDSYSAIKAIAKKHPEKVLPLKEKFLAGFTDKLKQTGTPQTEAEDAAQKVWQICSDACGYSFNSSHSVATALDSMYCAYAKGNYPLETYAAMLDIYSERGDKDKIDRCKAEMKQGFGISIAPCKFGQDNRSTFIDREHNAISDRLVSMKGIGHQIADILYELGKEKWKYSHFIDLVFRVTIGWNIADDPRLRGIDDKLPVTGMKIQSNVMEALIKADYFEEYGGSKKLLTLYDEFKNGKNKLTTSLKAKNFGTRYKALINIEETLPNESISPYEKVKFEGDVFGSPKAVYPELKGEYYVLDVTNERGVRVNMYSMSTGKLGVMRVKASDFKKYPIEKGEAIRILKWKKDYANRKDANGDWVKDYNRPELWLQIPEKIPLEQISLKT